jgi:hypothetical protein
VSGIKGELLKSDGHVSLKIDFRFENSLEGALMRRSGSGSDERSDGHWSQIRRCHRCGEVHEANGERVLACSQCGARFAPFYFADTTPRVLLRRPLPRSLKQSLRRYRPLVGIAEWWSDTQTSSEQNFTPRA